ncbi:MAG: hypothetical protein ACSNEK_06345 [Parachlamydiaceae bacterium]
MQVTHFLNQPLDPIQRHQASSSQDDYHIDGKVKEAWSRRQDCSIQFNAHQEVVCDHNHPQKANEFLSSDCLQLYQCMMTIIQTAEQLQPSSCLSNHLIKILKNDYHLFCTFTPQAASPWHTNLISRCHQLFEVRLKDTPKQPLFDSAKQKKKRPLDHNRKKPLVSKRRKPSQDVKTIGSYSVTTRYNGRNQRTSLRVYNDQIVISTHNHGQFKPLPAFNIDYLVAIASKIEKCKSSLEKEALNYQLPQEVIDDLIQPDVRLLEKIYSILEKENRARPTPLSHGIHDSEALEDEVQAQSPHSGPTNKASLSFLLNST